MKLYKDIDFLVQIGDIETLKEFILFKFYNPDTKEWKEFRINKWQNDLYDFVKFYTSSNIDWVVYYNGLDFDGVIIEYVLRNYTNWVDLNSMEIIDLIYKYVQNHIDNRSHNIGAEFKEYHFSTKVLDVYTILGLDNEARRSSLKKCEFQLDWESVEEMPIHHNSTNLSEEDCEIVSNYCSNDILATYELLKLTIGDTNHPVYKGNNQLSLRDDIKEEFGLTCYNSSDIRIGDELLKLSYAKEINVPLKELPHKGYFRKKIDLKKCFPSYIKFKTPQLQALFTEIKKSSVSQTDKWEKKFKFYNTQYVQGFGGLHSVNDNQQFIENENYCIITADVASMYPASIVNNGYYPYHLGKELLNVYKKLYHKRLEIKPLTKTDKKMKGISDALKLVLNSVFGKMGSMESWLYDKQALLSVTLTGQFSLLMLIEELELNGFKVIIANTDGIETLVKRDKIEEYFNICKKWEEVTNYNLEYDYYSKIYMSTVNDYLAITTSGKVKLKGDLISDFELWKNKSNRVVALAVREYLTKGVLPELFIKNHQNIFDFCIMARATGNLHLELQKVENGQVEIQKLKKLVRYYISSTSKWQLYKRGIGSTGKSMNVNQNAPNDIGDIYIEYFNQYNKLNSINDYNIDYKQYIYKAYKLIDKCSGSKLTNRYLDSLKPVNQMSLF